MRHGGKWTLPLCLLFGAVFAAAQPNTVGTTTLDYDEVDNLLIGTCTVGADYSTEANYGPYEECQIVDMDTNSIVASGADSNSSMLEFTPSGGHTYIAWGEYMNFFRYYTLVWINPPFYYSFNWYDPFLYSVYGNNQQYPSDQHTWWGYGPYNYVTSTYTYLGQVPSNPKAPQCFAQLKYRSIVGGQAVHTFWYIQTYDKTLNQSTQYIVDGGPTIHCGLNGCGYLNSGVTSGSPPFFSSTFIPDDTTAVGTYWTTGNYPDSASCAGASSILATGLYWNQNSITYEVYGPNSNTFAGDAGINAGFNVAPWNMTAPPNAVGWP